MRSSCSISDDCRTTRSSCAARLPRRSLTQSARSRFAAHPRSAWRPRTGSRSPRRAGRISTPRTRCSRRRARPPLISAGRSTRCGTIRRRSARGRCTRRRSSAAGGWGEHALELVPRTCARVLTHCNTGGLATGGYGIGARCRARGVGGGSRRARVGRRDAAAPPGSAPDGMGARRAGYPVLRDRGRCRRRRSWRPARSTPSSRAPTGSRERRRREQGRDLRARRRGRVTTRSRSTWSRRRRRSTPMRRPARTSRSRSAIRVRGLGAVPRPESGLRRHAGRARLGAIVTGGRRPSRAIRVVAARRPVRVR